MLHTHTHRHARIHTHAHTQGPRAAVGRARLRRPLPRPPRLWATAPSRVCPPPRAARMSRCGSQLVSAPGWPCPARPWSALIAACTLSQKQLKTCSTGFGNSHACLEPPLPCSRAFWWDDALHARRPLGQLPPTPCACPQATTSCSTTRSRAQAQGPAAWQGLGWPGGSRRVGGHGTHPLGVWTCRWGGAAAFGRCCLLVGDT